jgi:hypothetical protein
MLQRFKAFWVAVVLGVTSAGPALAQAQVADPEGTVVSELVVRAIERGPAWWRISEADSTVYILGVPDEPAPPGVAWDRSALERRLQGARVLIAEPGFAAGLRDIPAIFRLRAQLRSKVPMETTLPAPLAARYAAVAGARSGKRANRFSDWQPMAAGAFLLRESRGGWSTIEPQIRRIARQHGVKVERAATYKAMPLAQTAMKNMTPQIQQSCLGWALDDVEAGEPPSRRAAEGWARGDVATALTAPRGFDKCLLVLAGGAELWSRMTEDQANDIAAALKTPGHAVAVVGLRRLLAGDGVIARLEARGLSVKGPGEP